MNNTRFNIINEIDTPPYYMNHVTHNESRNSPTDNAFLAITRATLTENHAIGFNQKDVVEAVEFMRSLLKEYDTIIQEKLYIESTYIDGYGDVLFTMSY